MRTRAKYYRDSFEDNSRKFSKIENENEGNIFESFGIPRELAISIPVESYTSKESPIMCHLKEVLKLEESLS